MIILNLLPPEKKYQLISEQHASQYRHILVWLWACCLLATGIVGVANYSLRAQTRALTRKSETLQQSLTSSGRDSNALVDAINVRLHTLQTIQQEHIAWSDLLSRLMNALPESVTLTAVSLDTGEKTATIGGIARTRADLLAAKEALERLGFISGIETPISNLIKKEDIPFTFQGTLTITVTAP